MMEMRNAYKVLTGNPQLSRPLMKRRRKLEDNSKMYLRVIGVD